MIVRLSYSQLDALHAKLVERQTAEQIDVCRYIEDWDRLVMFAGWTWNEVRDQIDHRWLEIGS